MWKLQGLGTVEIVQKTSLITKLKLHYIKFIILEKKIIITIYNIYIQIQSLSGSPRTLLLLR